MDCQDRGRECRRLAKERARERASACARRRLRVASTARITAGKTKSAGATRAKHRRGTGMEGWGGGTKVQGAARGFVGVCGGGGGRMGAGRRKGVNL